MNSTTDGNKNTENVDITKPKVNLLDIASPNMTPEASKVVSDALERSAEVMNRVTTERDIDGILDTYKEETEDLWEQFMEGDSPDPQKYDDFLDTATSKAKQSITSLIKELVAEAKPERQPPMKMGNPTKESSDLDKMIFAKKKGHNEAIDQFEQNLLKALEEV